VKEFFEQWGLLKGAPRNENGGGEYNKGDRSRTHLK
jgi:hypothetical protein